MGAQDDRIKTVTSQLNQEQLWDLALDEPEIRYRPVPYAPGDPQAGPVWRVRFDLTHDPGRRIGLDINGETILGRSDEDGGVVSLNPFDGEALGVSRRHCVLRPTPSKLYIIDLGSTNGTRCNGRSIGVNTPYSLSNGNLLSIGKLEMVVRIIDRPVNQTASLQREVDAEDLLADMARAITSQLDVDDVLKQALEYTRALTGADEVSIWLVDEQSGELFLEAEQGIDDEHIRRMRLPVADTLAGKVIATGKQIRANRAAGGEQIKLKTGYLVDAVLYVPLKLGGVTFGVMAVAHRKDGRSLSHRDEKLAVLVAEMAAIAIQNARFHQATERALARRAKMLTALNYTLSYDLKKLLNSILGYAGLLNGSDTLDEEGAETASQIYAAAHTLTEITDRLIEVTGMGDGFQMRMVPCDLLDAVMRAVSEMERIAASRDIAIEFRLVGAPTMILGDATYLYRSALNLIENAVKFSPPRKPVLVTLAFGREEILLRVRDRGQGIPEEDLPYIFDKYFRSNQTLNGKAGLGLGLELVRTTAEAHKGSIVAYNADDEQGGAEFVMTLPASLRTS